MSSVGGRDDAFSQPRAVPAAAADGPVFIDSDHIAAAPRTGAWGQIPATAPHC
jgi:hypothetical protein